MAYGTEIKVFTFPTKTAITGSLIDPIYTSHSINGEILKVTAITDSAAGSVYFGVSGTNEALGIIPQASGTITVVQYPRAALSTPAGVALTYASGGQAGECVPVNEPLFYAGSGFGSGTSVSLKCSIYYK